MLSKIKKYNLCNGCGLCSSVFGYNKIEIKLNQKGFYEPYEKIALTSKENDILKKICPGIHVECRKHKGDWGPLLKIHEGWSANKDIRYKAASGGAITALALYLLEYNKIDAILQVGVKDNSYLFNELKISKSSEDIVKCAQSRYAPCPTMINLKQILDSTNYSFGIIGKPCDIVAVKNFTNEYPQYSNRIKYFLSIFCAGMPSYNASIKAWKKTGKTEEPIFLKYRGEGWPGYFECRWDDGSSFKLNYAESWGKILGPTLGYRCKICPDCIGMAADISVGDSWNTKDGFPDFEDAEGKCFIMVRTDLGQLLLNDAMKAGYLEIHDLDINKVKVMQTPQYIRRQLEGWRILPLQILSKGILNFKNLNILKRALSVNIIRGLKECFGSYKRLIK